MPPRDENDKPTKRIDSAYAGSTFGLKNAEEEGNTTNANNTSDDVKKSEESPGYINNVKGSGKQIPSKTDKAKLFLKKKAATIAIVAALAGGGVGVGVLSPAFIGPAILANFVTTFNPSQEISAFYRTNAKYKAWSDEATSGFCGTKVTFLCRITRPSNYSLKQLKSNGILALDIDGHEITKNTFLPNSRPAKYRYTNSAGKEVDVEAKELYTTLVNDSQFRGSFNSASKTRFMTVVDAIFDKIKVKFGFKTTDKLKSIDSDEKLANAIDEEVPIDSEMKAAAAEGAEEMESTAKKLIQEEADNSVEKLAKAGRASAINLISGAVCLATDIPGLISKANRTFQMGQFIKYSMVFLSAFGATKAGDATPEEVAAIGNLLTTQDKNGKSAMDSFGMKYAMTGDTVPSSDNYKDYAPGGNINGVLKKVTKATDNKAKRTTCKVAMDPKTGVAIDVAFAESGVGLPALAFNIIGGLVLSEVAAKALPPVLDYIISFIPVKDILLAFIGDQTQDITGEDVGDALASGASHVMGQSANAGGNMPLSVEDAVAYENLNKQVQLAYAEEDRATLSPFDTSSPYTMMGSIVQKLLPYYTSASSTVGSISHSLSFISSTVMGSLGTILQPLTAKAESTSTKQYDCEDPNIQGKDVATGPFCNIKYGVPVQYLDDSIVTVAQKLIDDKQIDEFTGGIIEGSDLETWASTCTDGAAALAEECKVKDEETAYYSLYIVDNRIQTYMEGPAISTATGEAAI
ncbi:MAG: hypothetical protein WA087_01235 [Candidatus Saccharimonadales bacterium]